jgi:RNAse (barnase) inhibitor barstar
VTLDGKKTLAIDGNRFDDLEGFWDEVQKVLTDNLEGFGRNLDAFNDILMGGFGRFGYNESINLVWRNSAKSRTQLGYDAYIKHFKYTLSHSHPANKEYIKESIRLAKQKIGPTLFDELVNIIGYNKNVNLILE